MLLDALAITSQEVFLNNAHNKSALIAELSQALLSKCMKVAQTEGDADLSIALSAISASETANGYTLVVSRETNVLILSLAKLGTAPVWQTRQGNKHTAAETKFRASTLFHSASIACHNWVWYHKGPPNVNERKCPSFWRNAGNHFTRALKHSMTNKAAKPKSVKMEKNLWWWSIMWNTSSLLISHDIFIPSKWSVDKACLPPSLPHLALPRCIHTMSSYKFRLSMATILIHWTLAGKCGQATCYPPDLIALQRQSDCWHWYTVIARQGVINLCVVDAERQIRCAPLCVAAVLDQRVLMRI